MLGRMLVRAVGLAVCVKVACISLLLFWQYAGPLITATSKRPGFSYFHDLVVQPGPKSTVRQPKSCPFRFDRECRDGVAMGTPMGSRWGRAGQNAIWCNSRAKTAPGEGRTYIAPPVRAAP